jgi:uncharacterized protein (DUF2267 family)
MEYREFIRTVRARGGFESDQQAVRSAVTTLQTLGELVPGASKAGLLLELPGELRRPFERSSAATVYSLDEFLGRVATGEGATYEDAERDVLVVIGVLRDAVGAQELERLWTRLPAEYRRLLNPGVPPAPGV